ncbi:hypothetical protein Psyaliredsea_22640 [Psychrobacter alimentarius]
MIDDAQVRFREALEIANEQPDTLPLILGFDADSGAIVATEKTLSPQACKTYYPYSILKRVHWISSVVS